MDAGSQLEPSPVPGGRPLGSGDGAGASDALLELYGEGLERIVAALNEAGAAGEALRTRLAEDGVVSSLLMIRASHPVPLETW